VEAFLVFGLDARSGNNIAKGGFTAPVFPVKLPLVELSVQLQSYERWRAAMQEKGKNVYRFSCLVLVLAVLGAGATAVSAQAAPADDLEALQRALDRIGEGTPADPREERSPAHRGAYNVMEFGAKGDGVTDDTAAFQKALNAAFWDGGGVVSAPTGRFLIQTHLVIPSNVTLEGVWRKPHWGQYATGDRARAGTAGPAPSGSTEPPEMMGTILLAVEGKGEEDGTPFITLNGAATDAPAGMAAPMVNGTVSGITIFYPEQIRANPPHAYPWTIRGNGDDCGILNVNMVNAYQGVDFGTYACGRHFIDGLYAYPFKTGIYVNATFDVGRLHNIHLWPFFDVDPKSPLWEYTRAHGTAFKFGRTDGEQIINCFSIFYNIGVHLIGGPVRESGPGEPERFEYFGGAGAFTNVYIDVSETSILVDDSMENSGYSFNNCFIMGQVVVGPRNRGPIRFNGCGFWATSDLDSHAVLSGVSAVIFTGCHFANWDRANEGAPCIYADARRVLITGNEFLNIRPNKTKVVLGPNVRDAVITSNLMMGGVDIENNAPAYADVQIAQNAGSEVEGSIRRWTIVGPFPNAEIPGIDDPNTPSRTGFDTDFLESIGGEEEAVLRLSTPVTYATQDGETITRVAANVPTNDAARLDFARRLKTNHQVGYAFVEFESDAAKEYDIFFGSADSAKIWVNGELVHSVWTPERTFAPGQDRFKIQAKEGLNRMLVKVEKGPGSFWEFMLEARDKDGGALDLLRSYQQQ
jgi:hypothetical protein